MSASLILFKRRSLLLSPYRILSPSNLDIQLQCLQLLSTSTTLLSTPSFTFGLLSFLGAPSDAMSSSSISRRVSRTFKVEVSRSPLSLLLKSLPRPLERQAFLRSTRHRPSVMLLTTQQSIAHRRSRAVRMFHKQILI